MQKIFLHAFLIYQGNSRHLFKSTYNRSILLLCCNKEYIYNCMNNNYKRKKRLLQSTTQDFTNSFGQTGFIISHKIYISFFLYYINHIFFSFGVYSYVIYIFYYNFYIQIYIYTFLFVCARLKDR